MTLDFVLRLIFFAVVPFLVTRAAVLFPMTGPIAGMAVSLLVFVFADAVRGWAKRFRLVRLLVAGELALEEHYRATPPRPFVYYVFFPLLFPYWLAVRDARKELWLFRGLSLGGVVVLVALGAFDYARHWLPEIALFPFVKAWVLVFVAQTACMLGFLLPIATTVITYHLQGRALALRILFATAALSIGLAVGDLAAHKGPIVSLVTVDRVRLRIAAEPALADAAELAAVRGAWANLAELKASTEPDGWVEGEALDRALGSLELFFKADEAAAFTLHALPVKDPDIVVLQCHLGRSRSPVFKAMKKNGRLVTNAADLPPGILGTKPRDRGARKPSRR